MSGKKTLVFANRKTADENAALWDEKQNYGLDNIVYIRGTKEGFENIKPYIIKFYNNRKSSITKNKKSMINRYIDLKMKAFNIVPNELQKAMDGKTIEQWQRDWAQAIGEALSAKGVASSADAANALSKMQQAISQLSHISQLSKTADTMIEELENLETLYAKMSENDKKMFFNMFNPDKLEGKIISIGDDGLVKFDRAKANIEKIKNYTYVSTQGITRSINREAGYLNEIIDTWAIQKGISQIEKKIGQSGLTINQTGALTPEQNQTTISSMAKPDSAITYTVKIGDNNLDFQVGISYKVSGALSNGQTWKNNDELQGKYIQIFDTRKAYPLLVKIFGNSAMAHNSNLNTLVWENAGSNNYKIISKSVTAKFLEQFIAGGGTKLKNSNIIDQADVLIVNGKTIPIIDILYQVIAEFENETSWSQTKGVVQNNFSFVTKNDKNREKDYSKKDLQQAIYNSSISEKELMNQLRLIVKLNGKLLYDYLTK